MKAIILAAGQGTRLRPFTDERPKALVKLSGKTLLDRARESLAQAGITDLTVVAGYRAELIKRARYRVVVNPRFATSNMVVSLMTARHILDGAEDVLVCYGDIVFEPRVVQALVRSDAPFPLAINLEWQKLWSLRMEDPLQDAETLRLDTSGAIVEIGKRPRSLVEIQGQYMGLFKIGRSVQPRVVRLYDEMPRDVLYEGRSFADMFMTTFLQYLIDNQVRIQAVPVEGGWLEVDSVKDLRRYEGMISKGSLDSYCRLA